MKRIAPDVSRTPRRGAACRRWLAMAGVFALMLSACPDAAAQCDVSVPPPRTEPERRNHHPVGRSLPAAVGFRQPDGCTEAFWFFDQDGDGRAGQAEPRLFGPQRAVACGSCHSPEPPAESMAASQSLLRQDPKTLCLVCHSL